MFEFKLVFVLTLCSTIIGRQCVLSAETTSAVQSGLAFEMIMTKLQYLEDRWAEKEEQFVERFCDLICNKKPTMQHNAANDLNKVCDKVYNSCNEVPSSGIYTIQPDKSFKQPMSVLCDQEYESGGWIVIQHRFNGSIDFYRCWQEYKNGFGNLDGEFWLGLERIHQLTASRPHELLILLEDFDGNKTYARYDQFEIGTEDEKYALQKLGKYSGTAGNSFVFHKDMKFTTFDSDNDTHDDTEINCAITYTGAWWYHKCHHSNLNGKYLRGETEEYATGMVWLGFRGNYHSLKMAKMMIKPKQV